MTNRRQHQQQQRRRRRRRRQYVEALAATAAAAAVAAERVGYHTTHDVPLARARKLHSYASTHTQSMRKSHIAAARAAQRLLAAAAAAADRPNSSRSSTQQRRRRGSGGGQLRPSEPHIVRLMTPCLGDCVLTYASARGVHTHKVNEILNNLHTAEATAAQPLFAAAADRPNCSSSSMH